MEVYAYGWWKMVKENHQLNRKLQDCVQINKTKYCYVCVGVQITMDYRQHRPQSVHLAGLFMLTRR